MGFGVEPKFIARTAGQAMADLERHGIRMRISIARSIRSVTL